MIIELANQPFAHPFCLRMANAIVQPFASSDEQRRAAFAFQSGVLLLAAGDGTRSGVVARARAVD